MKIDNGIAILLSLSVIFLALVGCSAGGGIGVAGREENARKVAEEYAEKLRVAVNDDSIIFTDDKPSVFGDDFFTFSLWTDKYEQNFIIGVNGNILTDSYSTTSVRDSAREEWGRVLDEFTGYHISYEIGVDSHISASALSMTTFDSIYEAQDAYTYPSLVQAVITFNNEEDLNQERIYNLLEAVRGQGLLGQVTFAGDEFKYDVDTDGLYVWAATGADGGNFIERVPFAPDVE